MEGNEREERVSEGSQKQLRCEMFERLSISCSLITNIAYPFKRLQRLLPFHLLYPASSFLSYPLPRLSSPAPPLLPLTSRVDFM